MRPASNRHLLPAAVLVGGAATAVFITGTQQVWAMVAFFLAAGVAAMVAAPVQRAPALPVALGWFFFAATLLVHLPAAWFPAPAWKAALAAGELYGLGSTVVAVPAIAWWWSIIVAGTVLSAWILLTSPLQGRQLAAFLHLVAAVVGAYAVVSITVRQAGWAYPFAENDVFGLLPNRNHTATVLVLGSIVAFGLMQWELVRGHRAAAAAAALCGAPAIAALLFFSISRAGILMLGAGFVLWAAGAARSAANRRIAAVSATILAVFLAGLFVFGGSTVRDRLADLWQRAIATERGGPAAEAEIDFRRPVFEDTLRMIADAPLTGVGLGHFEPVFAQYRAASLRQVAVLHPESSWLMVAAECGWPAVMVLGGLAVWFLVCCWRARDEDDGLLRWTVASGVGAALLHGLIDVPWHRPASGWFLLVAALAVVPPTNRSPRFPALQRSFQLIAGLALLGWAGWLGWQNTTDRPPLGYRWPAYEAALTALREQQNLDEGMFLARAAVRDFPLNPRAHIWHLGLLSTFLGTEPIMEESTRFALQVDPVQPRTAAGVAAAWAGTDDAAEAGAWVEAIRRASRIDTLERRSDLPSAGDQMRVALDAARERPGVQNAIGDAVSADPILLACWLRSASEAPVQARLRQILDLAPVLDASPAKLQRELLDRLIGLPDPSSAVAYMEARNTPAPGPYWKQLAMHEAATGDKAAAVARVAQAAGVRLGSRGLDLNDFGRQLAELESQGNNVAVRRLLAEAADGNQRDRDKLAVAMAWFAAAGDWDKSWQAASRLAQMTGTAQ